MSDKDLHAIIRMPNWLGDAVMATPVIELFKQLHPKSTITLICRRPVEQLFTHHKHVNEVISFDKVSNWIHNTNNQKLIQQLSIGRYTTGLLLTNSLSSTWHFYKAKIRQRIGFKYFPRSYFLTDKVELPQNYETNHLCLTYQSLLSPLGLKTPNPHIAPKLYVSDSQRQQAIALINKHCTNDRPRVIGINPGAAYGSAKCWIPERFTHLADQLIRYHGAKIFFTGDHSHFEMIQKIVAPLGPHAINLAGKTSIGELMAFIDECDLYITNDSGPMHIADALKTPLVALFGSTNHIKTGPYSQPEGVITQNVACSPCYKRECPIDFRCMKRITTDMVLQKALKALNAHQ